MRKRRGRGEWKTWRNNFIVKVDLSSNLYITSCCGHLNSSRGRSSQSEKEGRARRGGGWGGRDVVQGLMGKRSDWISRCTACCWCWRRWRWCQGWWWCWRQSYLTLQPANSLKRDKRSRRTAINNICFVIDADFCFQLYQVFAYCVFSYFLTISFGFIGIFLTWYEVSIEYCLLLTVESKSQMSQWQGPLMNCPTQSSGRLELLSMIMVVSNIVKDITDLSIEFFLPKLLLKQLQRAINKLTPSCDQTIPISGRT